MSLLASIALAARPAPRPHPVDLTTAKKIDLSWAFDDKTLYWPTSPSGFDMKPLFKGQTKAGFFYSANVFSAPEHGGTHLDAPVHFFEKGWAADEVPVDHLMGPAFVIDVSAKAAVGPDYRLSVEDVTAFEAKNGQIPAGAIVLLRTGWGKRWPDRKQYFGDDTPNDASKLHFPSYGRESAELLVDQRKVVAIGVDTASIDYGPSKDFVVHQIACKANVLGLENIAHLEDVPETGAWVIALPMKIKGGSGGPLRAVALVPR